jgi:hypothetical protein
VKVVDATTWEFKLRKGVKFHDGGELTAEDVAFSIDRVAQIPNSPGPFVAYTKAIVAKQIVDSYTIRFKTATPYPAGRRATHALRAGGQPSRGGGVLHCAAARAPVARRSGDQMSPLRPFAAFAVCAARA